MHFKIGNIYNWTNPQTREGGRQEKDRLSIRLGKAVDNLLASLNVIAVHTKIDLGILWVDLAARKDDNLAGLCCIVLFDLGKQLAFRPVKAVVAVAAEQTVLKSILVLKELGNHQGRAGSSHSRIDVDQVTLAILVKQNVNAAETKESERLAVCGNVLDKWQLHFLQDFLVLHQQVRVHAPASILTFVILIRAEPCNIAGRVHEKVACNVSSNIDKLRNDIRRLAARLDKLFKLALVLVVANNENALAGH